MEFRNKIYEKFLSVSRTSMGRAKLNMELISQEKSRNTTYKKRKEGLMKKMKEFTTLCDVKACIIIYGPRQENGTVQPEIWPEDADEVRRIISIYKSKCKDSGNKTFGLPDFFHDRKRKIEEELLKLRKKNMESKYPTRPEFMNFMTEAQLREFAGVLAHKAEYVRNRIEFLRRNVNEGGGLMGNMNLMDYYGVINPREMHVPIDHHNQEMHAQNSLMMLLMKDNDRCLQFNGASAAGNIQCTFKREVSYEVMAGMGVMDHPMMCTNPMPLARYYNTPAMGPMVPQPQYMQFPGIESSDGVQDDVLQFLIKNQDYSF